MAGVARRAKPEVPEVDLDLGRYELRRMGRRIKLQKQAMELLIFLVERREQLVSRDDIVARLWMAAGNFGPAQAEKSWRGSRTAAAAGRREL